MIALQRDFFSRGREGTRRISLQNIVAHYDEEPTEAIDQDSQRKYKGIETII
jgi:hypothetical protein